MYVQGELLKELQCLNYIGSHVEKTDVVETEVKSRAKERCQVLGALSNVMSCRTLGLEAKINL